MAAQQFAWPWAEIHGYRPSAAARRLATGQSGTLGLVFPRERNMLGDLIFTDFMGGALEKASDMGYEVSLAMARGEETEEAVYRRAVRAARVDGMILSSPLRHDPRIALLKQLGMPFVLHGRTVTDEPHAFLDIDNEGAFFQATKLLIDLGHRRIAFLNFDDRFNFAQDRRNGHIKALNQSGLTVNPALCRSVPMLETTGREEARSFLAMPRQERPTAFLCSSISQAQGVRRVVREMGRKIGEDVSLIAHDDRLKDLRAENFDPPLTATQSSISDAGKHVVEMLIRQLREPTLPPAQVIWPVDVVVRASTGPVKD